MEAMFRKSLLAVGVLGGLLAAASYFSPHWTIHRMRSAIEARDYKAFSSYVDFPSLRESFKRQLTPSNNVQADGRQGVEGALEALGQGVAGALVSPMVDVVVGPAGVVEMINAGSPRITRAVLTSSITQVPTAADSIPEMKVKYQGWNSVAFRGRDAPADEGSFVLSRDGWWSWRLAAVALSH
jgi:hypothetical protein